MWARLGATGHASIMQALRLCLWRGWARTTQTGGSGSGRPLLRAWGKLANFVRHDSALRAPPACMQEEFFLKFAEFEEKAKEVERARAIYKCVLESLSEGAHPSRSALACSMQLYQRSTAVCAAVQHRVSVVSALCQQWGVKPQAIAHVHAHSTQGLLGCSRMPAGAPLQWPTLLCTARADMRWTTSQRARRPACTHALWRLRNSMATARASRKWSSASGGAFASSASTLNVMT